MAVPLSGSLDLAKVRQELETSDYNAGPYTAAATSLSSSQVGVYATINIDSPYQPNGLPPYELSKWYGYDHDYTMFSPTSGSALTTIATGASGVKNAGAELDWGRNIVGWDYNRVKGMSFDGTNIVSGSGVVIPPTTTVEWVPLTDELAIGGFIRRDNFTLVRYTGGTNDIEFMSSASFTGITGSDFFGTNSFRGMSYLSSSLDNNTHWVIYNGSDSSNNPEIAVIEIDTTDPYNVTGEVIARNVTNVGGILTSGAGLMNFGKRGNNSWAISLFLFTSSSPYNNGAYISFNFFWETNTFTLTKGLTYLDTTSYVNSVVTSFSGEAKWRDYRFASQAFVKVDEDFSREGILFYGRGASSFQDNCPAHYLSIDTSGTITIRSTNEYPYTNQQSAFPIRHNKAVLDGKLALYNRIEDPQDPNHRLYFLGFISYDTAARTITGRTSNTSWLGLGDGSTAGFAGSYQLYTYTEKLGIFTWNPAGNGPLNIDKFTLG